MQALDLPPSMLTMFKREGDGRAIIPGRILWSQFYEPLAPILASVQESQDGNNFTLNLRGYARHQPAYTHPMLRYLQKRSTLLSLKDVSDSIYETAWHLIVEMVEEHGAVTLLTTSMTSSSMLAILLLMHASRDDAKELIKAGKISLRSMDGLTEKQHRQHRHYILIEDAVYSGRTLATSLKKFLKLEEASGPFDITVCLPLATEEAVSTVKSTMRAHRVVVGRRQIETLFQGRSLAYILQKDAFLRESQTPATRPQGRETPETRSYAFDVLGLDDRHSLMLLKHKVSDMSMAPFKLLHMWPDAPDNVNILTCADAHAAREIVRLSGIVSKSSSGFSNHALLSQYVKDNVDDLKSRGLLVGEFKLTTTPKSSRKQILPLDQDLYRRHLAAFL